MAIGILKLRMFLVALIYLRSYLGELKMNQVQLICYLPLPPDGPFGGSLAIDVSLTSSFTLPSPISTP